MDVSIAATTADTSFYVTGSSFAQLLLKTVAPVFASKQGGEEQIHQHHQVTTARFVDRPTSSAPALVDNPSRQPTAKSISPETSRIVTGPAFRVFTCMCTSPLRRTSGSGCNQVLDHAQPVCISLTMEFHGVHGFAYKTQPQTAGPELLRVTFP